LISYIRYAITYAIEINVASTESELKTVGFIPNFLRKNRKNLIYQSINMILPHRILSARIVKLLKHLLAVHGVSPVVLNDDVTLTLK
jgi:hypothetical protein